MTRNAGQTIGQTRRRKRTVATGRGWARAAFGLVCLCVLLAAQPALAQSVAPPATVNTHDSNGVDMVTGAFHLPSPAVSIGQPGMGGLAYQREYDSSIADWRDNVTGTINNSGSAYTVTLMGAAETFTLASGAYTPSEASGGTLTFSGTTTYTYTTSNGVVAIYLTSLASTQPTQANVARVSTITAPSGEVLTFTYTALSAAPFLAHRLQSVTNNLGYQLSFEYQTSTADATGLNLIKVTAINNTVDYCAPTANGCGLSGWPTLSFGTDSANTQTVTDALSRTTRYAYVPVTGAAGQLTGIRWPSSVADDITIAYTGGKVASIISAAGTWDYTWTNTFVSGVLTTTTGVVRDPLLHIQTYVASFPARRVTEYRDGYNNTTLFSYDSTVLGVGKEAGRTTQPEGNYTQITRDTRGNVTQVRQVAKAGSGLADIVTSAVYPASCSNPVTCNLPTSTTDARGFRTDYTYDATHGGLLTVTAPAPSGAAPVGSGTRPQTRYAYSQLSAWYKNSGGTIVQAPSAVYRLASVSSCATSASCSGGADETISSLTYGTSGVANNLLPTSTSSGAGNGSLTATETATYDTVGNVLTVDGPLSGTADSARIRYDAVRQRIGVIGPDPDGAGTLKHRAMRYTYNGYGLVAAVERGTVNSQSDGDWSAFAVLEQVSIDYDAALRQTRESFIASGATHAITQYSYDAASRLDCVAVRMNSAVFGSLPASACTLSTEGANGPDRISRTTYDNNNRPLTSISAYGTSAQQTTSAQTYSANGQAASLTDANGNLTTTEYDGFDRVRKIRFPNAAGGGSSTTDYEQYTYDVGSNITQDRRRDGATISFAYDNLSRPTLMTPSSGSAVTTSYDSFGRATSVAYAGVHTLSFVYDQLSRATSATRVANGATHTVSYQYDVAGRRTRVTWPDALYAQYDHDLIGEVTAIRENGASSGVGVLATYAYDNHGRRTSVTRGNGTATTYAYNSASLLQALTQDLAATPSDSDVTFGFTYSAAGQSLTRTRTSANASYVWTQPALGADNTVANGRNQIASLNSANFSYDGRGNLTAAGSASYSYDVFNRLTGAGTAALAYDPAGRLYETVGGGVTTRFLYDGMDAIAEYNSSGTMLRRYVHGPGVDEPIVWYEGGGTTDRRWLIQDQLGSVIAVTNASGAALSINSYDEYGVPGSSNAGRFQYTGQMWLTEASLYHYKARAYLPALGRFAQSDPILYAGGMNIYAYVGNDPVNARDPSGLQEGPPPEEEPEIVVTGVRPYDHWYGVEDFERVHEMLMAARWAQIRAFLARQEITECVGEGCGDETAQQEETTCSSASGSQSAQLFRFLPRALLDPPPIVGGLPRPTVPYPGSDPTIAPQGFRWFGPGPQGIGRGQYHNPNTTESLRPDLSHPPGVAPHWDYIFRGPGVTRGWRWFDDGTPAGRLAPKPGQGPLSPSQGYITACA